MSDDKTASAMYSMWNSPPNVRYRLLEELPRQVLSQEQAESIRQDAKAAVSLRAKAYQTPVTHETLRRSI